MKRLCLIAISALMILNANLYAGKDIRVGTNVYLDDNIFRNYSERGDAVYVPYLNLGYGWKASDMDNLYLGYSGELFLFNEMSYRNFSIHGMSFDYNHLWPESQTLLALGGMFETRINREEYNYYDYTEGGIYAGVKRYLRENLTMIARYNLNAKSFDSFSEFNYLEQIFSAQFNWFLPSKTTISFSGRYFYKNYTSSIEYADSQFVESSAQLSSASEFLSERAERIAGGRMGPGQGRGPGSGQVVGGNDGEVVVTDPDGYYIYGVSTGEFESSDQIALGLSVAQNLAQNTGLKVAYEGRINPHNRNRYLANVGESVLNNEELFDDHYSYNGHEVKVQLKQILPDNSSITALVTSRTRKFSGRLALDLAGYPVGSGESRLDKAALFQLSYMRTLNFSDADWLRAYQLSVQSGYIDNSSNDEYYDYDSLWLSISLEKPF